VEWVVAGYGLAFALGLITGGRLGDRYGHRRVFIWGVAGFTVASVLCGAAPSPDALIAARLLQGTAAALMMPQVLSIIQTDFGPEDRGRALAVMGVVQGAAFVAGQLAGGGLIELDLLGLGWRSVFLVNVPVGLATIALALRFVRDSRGAPQGRLDLVGVGLGLATVAAVCVPLVEGRTAGWPLWTFASLAAALPLGVAFLRWERRVTERTGSPLVALGLFRLRQFRLGVAIALIVYAGMPGLFLAIAIYLQGGLGLEPLSAGAAFLPAAVTFAGFSLYGTRLSLAARERLLAPASALTAAGMACMGLVVALDGDATAYELAPALLAIGAGQGISVPGLNATVLAHTPAADAGSASGLLTTAQQIGGALGVAIAGTIFFGVLGDGTGSELYGDALGAATAFTATTMALCAVLYARLLSRREPAPAAEPATAG
jgi:MFS family permease